MKHYDLQIITRGIGRVLIRRAGWICLLLWLVLTSCRTTRDTQVSEVQAVQSATQNQEASHETHIGTTRDSVATETESVASEWDVKILYGDDGQVRELQARGRDVSVREVGRMVLGATDDSVKDTSGSSSSKTEATAEVAKSEVNYADSRPVQGIDWLYIVLGFGAVAAVAWAVRKIRKNV